MKLLLTGILSLTLFINCDKIKKKMKSDVLTSKGLSKYKKAYFASGCFWCVEAIFESVKGVKEVVSGYSGGSKQNPTYKKIVGGHTDYAEAVEVYYNPSIVSFKELVIVFFGSHNPTDLNGQGPDRGRQYRSIAFYQNEEEKAIITKYIQELENKNLYEYPIITEVSSFSKFWGAEGYHQNFKKNNPNHPYIKAISLPRLKKFQEKFSNYLKK